MAQIVAMKRRRLFGDGNYINGFAGRDVYGLFDCDKEYISQNMLVEREKAETDKTWKQLIPYVVIRNCETGGILSYSRSKKGSEDRLHDKRSIGIGGHIDVGDIGESLYDTITNCAVREILEELDIQLPINIIMDCLSYIGCVNEDTTEVGEVHFGIVHALNLNANAAFNVRPTSEGHVVDLRWIIPEMAVKLEQFELWSSLVMPVFFR